MDNYLSLFLYNFLFCLDPGAKAQFTKYNTNNLGAPYDTCSIMHYGQYHASRGPGMST
jgi:hypothetical protein